MLIINISSTHFMNHNLESHQKGRLLQTRNLAVKDWYSVNFTVNNFWFWCFMIYILA